MKIGIDTSFLAADTRGMGRANRNIITALLDEGTHEIYFVMVSHGADEPKIRKLFPLRELSFLSMGDSKAGMLDLFWFPWSRVDFFPSCRRIVTIHDLVPYRFSHSAGTRSGYNDRQRLKQACETADHIITPSEFSRQEIITYLDVPGERITAIHHGVEENFRPSDGEGDEHYLNHFSSGQPYILFVGSVEKRKNLSVLLEAFDLMKKEYELPHKLVVAGKNPVQGGGNGGGGFSGLLNRLGIVSPAAADGAVGSYRSMEYASDVVWLGEITEQQLLKLYSLAELFVFPSIYEGFGLPMLESFASGVPVLAADIPVFREIGHSAACYFPCRSRKELAENMYIILTDNKVRSYMRKAGFSRVKSFTWTNSAFNHLKVFSGVAAGV